MSDHVQLFHITCHEMPDGFSLVVGVVTDDDFRSGKINLGRPTIEIPDEALEALGVSLIQSSDE